MKNLVKFVFLALFLAATSAVAQTRATFMNAGTVCNAVTHAAARNCEIRNVSRGVYGVEGFNLLTLEILQDTDGAGGSTGYSFSLQACSEGFAESDCTDSTDWYTVQGEAYSAGTVTLADGVFSKTVTANTDSRSMYSIAINYRRLRLYNIAALTETNDADDTFTVKATIAYSGAF